MSRYAAWRALLSAATSGLIAFSAPSWVLTPSGTGRSSGPAVSFHYGAKYEPPEGRIGHGMGQWLVDNRAYVNMLGDSSLFPLAELCFFDIEPTRPWDMTLENVRTYLERQKKTGRLPNLNLGMSGPEKERVEWWRPGASVTFGVDDRVAHSTEYDERLRDVARLLRDHGTPCFLRIGGEFNGAWNGHHPFDYPQAFRKVVRFFRENGSNNTAFLWCYEPSAADDFDAADSAGNPKWFPGDDVIDWYSLDVFARKDFSAAYPEFERGQITSRGKSERFLRMAAEHRRPVMIAESSVMDCDVTAASVWEEWFRPYFDFLEVHPQIKIFVYVNADWPRYRPNDPFGWRDGRITENPEASARYVQELSGNAYLHAPQATSLHGFDEGLAVLHPPLDFSARRVIDHALLKTLSCHVLRWKADPGNGAVTAYRIYEIREGEPVLAAQTDGETFLYVHFRARQEGPYHYSLAAVDGLGVEGLAALATVR